MSGNEMVFVLFTLLSTGLLFLVDRFIEALIVAAVLMGGLFLTRAQFDVAAGFGTAAIIGGFFYVYLQQR